MNNYGTREQNRPWESYALWMCWLDRSDMIVIALQKTGVTQRFAEWVRVSEDQSRGGFATYHIKNKQSTRYCMYLCVLSFHFISYEICDLTIIFWLMEIKIVQFSI